MKQAHPVSHSLAICDCSAPALLSRRQLMNRAAGSLGAAALATLLRDQLPAGESVAGRHSQPGLPGLPHFAPQAKRVIYLFQSGGPSHLELFDYKPQLTGLHGTELPDSIRMGQRVTAMTKEQETFPCVAPMFKFAQHGASGTWVSELLPHTARIVDEITVLKSVHTEAINHDPAITLINTGSQQLGKASMGSWLSYGLGSDSHDLPAYVVMISRGPNVIISQPLFARLWGSGFLPSQHQGVRFRNGKNPVLYLSNPPGIDELGQRRALDGLNALNQLQAESIGDPEIRTRIAQYELAFRMQASIPQLMDLSDEPESIFSMYGSESRKPGTYAANCIRARRMAERGVRFIQIFHRGWDHHGKLPGEIRRQCSDTDQASTALIEDLRQRGMLDDTLVVWGGEFGRTVYCQGSLTKGSYGRDHHGRCFSIWMAGGGIRGGIVHGETDDFGYNIVEDPVHVRDVNATILHCLGINHARLTFSYQGLGQRLTGAEEAHVIHDILG